MNFPLKQNLRKLTAAALAVFVGIIALHQLWHWGFCRVYVAPNEALLVINKFGDSLPPERIVVPTGEDHYKGVQADLRGPGRYFISPISHDWKIVPLQVIPAGKPQDWAFDSNGQLKQPDTAPQIGLVSLKEGMEPPPGQEVVEAGYKGLQREVLTPGTYKVNPQQYEVTLFPATVVPPGSVGVVTRLSGDTHDITSAALTAVTPAPTTGQSGAATQPATPFDQLAAAPTRLALGPNQRGILTDVLQPGIYYLNPRLAKVTVVPVGYDAITLDHETNTSVHFYSNDGYQIEADLTVVWGRSPADAPQIVANIGNVDKVRENVIEPAMKAAFQNEGARYSAKELIQGTSRSVFQDALSTSLNQQVSARNVHVLLALIRNITVKDTSGNDATSGLLKTIQQTNIEKEKDLTNQQETITATKKAELEQTTKLVDVARETVAAETLVKTATAKAEGEKTAAETAGETEVKVAEVQKQVAELEAKRIEIMGKAESEVLRLKNEADAQGAKMLVDAFGSPESYNLYTFAKNFEPTDLHMIFAGPGTFWTDLKSFQDAAASRVLQPGQPAK
jgi:hypothetical protein